jgi:hypothetical protein
MAKTAGNQGNLSNDDYWDIIPIEAGQTHEIQIADSESLKTLPKIKFLLKEGDPVANYTLSIQPQGGDSVAFNVKISIVAGISLDKTLELN